MTTSVLFSNLISHYAIVFAICSAIAGAFWAFLKFRDYVKDRRFHTFHDLIDALVDQQHYPDREIKLDRQIAIVYELRNYTAYYPVVRRILSGLKENEWKESDQRIVAETNLTLDFISRNW